MRNRASRIATFAVIPALLVQCLAVSSQIPVARSTPPPDSSKRDLSDDLRIPPVMVTGPCQDARRRADQLLTESEGSVSPQSKASIEKFVAKPGPGVSSGKAWGDYAAAALMTGDTSSALWAGLRAAQIRWSGETATNAGIYLFHSGKTQDALQLLTCAYGSGYRSPYLLEALAVVHHAGGRVAEARQFITQAAQADPDDVLIETEASFINTGGPPPSRPPQRDPDGMDDALAELEAHAQRTLTAIKAQSDEIDQSVPDAKARDFYNISADYIPKVVAIARDQVRAARAAPLASRQIMINATLSMCISSYAQITDQKLSFTDTTETNGSPILLWSDVMGLDSAVLHREQEGGWKEPIRWSMHGGGPALSQPAQTTYYREKEAGDKEHWERLRACGDNDACRVRENARWCAVRREQFRRWEEASRQRHNKAARSFDRVATRRIIEAENEYLQLRDYAVRQLKKMKFPPPVAGFSMEKMTVDGINATIKPIYDRHLSSADDSSSGTVSYLRDRVRWFESERSSMDDTLAKEAEDIRRECEPAMRALMELLAQEEWQAYLDHLRDRLSWSVQPKTESSFPCEGNIGPLTIETDLNKPGEGKFDLKWKGKSFQAGGNVTVGSGGTTVGGGVGRKTSGVTLNAGGDSSGNAGIGGSGSYGPFQGKAKVTHTTKVSPWNSQEYLGIKIKGSAGLGLSTRQGQLGVKCFPSSGSVTIYPRAFYEDAVKYLSTPSSPPRRGQ
jgi:hypothetical protein